MQSVESILITGGSNFLGHHLIKHLELFMPNVKSIRVLEKVEFVKSLKYDSNMTVDWVDGTIFDDEALTMALTGVQAVFHLYEYKSYSMVVEEKKFQTINFEGTKRLLKACRAAGSVKYFVYGSSVDVLLSRKWHTVHHPETARIPPFNELAFPEYAKSKLQAEQLVSAETKFQTFIVRLGPMYGELDTDSWVMKSLHLAQQLGGVLPVVGDRDNVFQHTYVGNVAYGLVRVLQKMISDPLVTHEVTFLLDDTPLLEMHKNIVPFLEARNFHLSKRSVPFYPPYLSYRVFEFFVKSLSNFVDVSAYIGDWPASCYFFTFYYNWIFFKRVTERIFVDYKPLYSFEQSINASLPYYTNVNL